MNSTSQRPVGISITRDTATHVQDWAATVYFHTLWVLISQLGINILGYFLENLLPLWLSLK